MNNTLKKLGLGGNFFSEVGIAGFLEVLRVNTAIDCVDLQDNVPGLVGADDEDTEAAEDWEQELSDEAGGRLSFWGYW